MQNDDAHAHETTPEVSIDTTGLSDGIKSLGSAIQTAADAYNDEDYDFAKVSGNVIKKAGDVWTSFEETCCKPLADTITKLVVALRLWPAERLRLIAERNLANQFAFAEMENDIRSGLRSELRKEEAADGGTDTGDQPTSMNRRDDLQYQLEYFLAVNTGRTDGHIDKVSPTRTFLVDGVCAFLFAVFEYALGTDFFRASGGKRSRGIFSSILTVLAVVAITAVSAICCSHILQWLTDRFQFKRHFPDNKFGKDDNAVTIHFRPLSLITWIVGICGVLLLATFTVQMLFFRDSVALTSQLVKGDNMTAVILMVGVWVFFFVALFNSSKYPSHIVAEYYRLKTALDEANTAAATQLEAEEIDTEDFKDEETLDNAPLPADAVERAIAVYRRTIRKNDQPLKTYVQAFQQNITYHQQLEILYENARNQVAIPLCNANLSLILDAIERRFRRAKKPFDRAAVKTQASQTITDKIRRAFSLRLKNEELVRLIGEFDPSIPPAETFKQFDQLVENTRAQLLRETEAERTAQAQSRLEDVPEVF